MKYLVIALMPAEKDEDFFRLEQLLECSHRKLGRMLNSDQHILYQSLVVNSLTSAHEFLDALHQSSEMENIPSHQDRLQVTRLTHAVLGVSDDFDERAPLKDSVRLVYLLQPEAYVHQAINEQLDVIDARALSLHEAGEDYLEEYESVLIEQALLQSQLQQLIAQPFLEFHGPQFEVGNALTPILMHRDVDAPDSPLLQRQQAFVGQRMFDAHAGVQNNNNNNNSDTEEEEIARNRM